MSDKQNPPEPVEAPANEAEPGHELAAEAPPEAPDDAAGTVRRGARMIGVVILLTLLWYITADRFTPYTSQARVEAYVVGVAPKVSGVVTDVWVTSNSRVEAGQRLFRIDQSQYQIALAKAEADLENARNQVAAGEAAVQAARAGLDAARANALRARQDSERQERLYEEDPGTISVRRLETARSSLKQANAQVVAAEADVRRAIEQMGGEDAANNAILKTARSALDKARLDLDNTLVTAESDGMITDLTAEAGRFAGAGNPVLTLIGINDVWISADFTENNLAHIGPGTPVEIVFDALPGSVFEGKVRSIGLGVNSERAHTPGTLPTVSNDRDWLREAQRFPVIVGFDVSQSPELRQQLRVGAQASVIAYSEGHGFLEVLGKAYIRLMSWLTYAY